MFSIFFGRCDELANKSLNPAFAEIEKIFSAGSGMSDYGKDEGDEIIPEVSKVLDLGASREKSLFGGVGSAVQTVESDEKLMEKSRDPIPGIDVVPDGEPQDSAEHDDEFQPDVDVDIADNVVKSASVSAEFSPIPVEPEKQKDIGIPIGDATKQYSGISGSLRERLAESTGGELLGAQREPAIDRSPTNSRTTIEVPVVKEAQPFVRDIAKETQQVQPMKTNGFSLSVAIDDSFFRLEARNGERVCAVSLIDGKVRVESAGAGIKTEYSSDEFSFVFSDDMVLSLSRNPDDNGKMGVMAMGRNGKCAFLFNFGDGTFETASEGIVISEIDGEKLVYKF